MALAAGEWHRTIQSTPGLGAPTDVACHGVFTLKSEGTADVKALEGAMIWAYSLEDQSG